MKSCCFSCCKEGTFVQDKSCCKFDIPNPTTDLTQTLYETNEYCELHATGSIMLCSSPVNGALGPQHIIVNFRLGPTVFETVIVNQGVCFLFTKRNFTAIDIVFPHVSATDQHYMGEFCIMPRYPVGN